MTLNDFLPLPHEEKIHLLYHQGVYIGKRKMAATTIVLYQLEGFYAEVFYFRYRRTIEDISCFSGTARLDPYLTDISIELLV